MNRMKIHRKLHQIQIENKVQTAFSVQTEVFRLRKEKY